jgi:hypothetical protein
MVVAVVVVVIVLIVQLSRRGLRPALLQAATATAGFAPVIPRGSQGGVACFRLTRLFLEVLVSRFHGRVARVNRVAEAADGSSAAGGAVDAVVGGRGGRGGGQEGLGPEPAFSGRVLGAQLRDSTGEQLAVVEDLGWPCGRKHRLIGRCEFAFECSALGLLERRELFDQIPLSLGHGSVVLRANSASILSKLFGPLSLKLVECGRQTLVFSGILRRE